MPPSNPPDKLRPYLFHGLTLRACSGGEAVGDCPFCDRTEKFSVSVETGQWKCWVCGGGQPNGGGNAITFLRALWDRSDEATEDYAEMLTDRRLLDQRTLMAWGVVRSIIGGAWMVPGYSADGRLVQLYKRLRVAGRWELRPTPTLGHALYGVQLYDPRKSTVYLHESWGNAMAFWEVAGRTKIVDGRMVATAAVEHSLLADSNVLSVANCGAVGKSLERYAGLFTGKRLVLCFDSDRPLRDGADGAGPAAARRAAKMLGLSRQPPASIEWLRWGPAGYDPNQCNGYDVRDLLTKE